MMMSLVDYGGSSDSENEDNQDDNNSTEINSVPFTEKQKTPETKDSNAPFTSNFRYEHDEVEESLKMRVPGNIKLEEIIKSKPRKKKKGKVLIKLPTFSDDSDSEGESNKSGKSSRVTCGPRKGLTSLLPPPKAMIVREGNRPMIPHSLTKKPAAAKAKAKPSSSTAATAQKADAQETEEPVTSFFTLEDDEVIPEVVKLPTPQPKRETKEPIIQQEIGPQRPTAEEMPPPPSNTISFDEKVLPVDFIPQVELRNQRKRKRDEPIDIIDIRQDELTAGVEIELTKGISQEEDEFKKAQSSAMPSRMAASKHQITWLAYKAKEQEFELKNSWATAKYNKMQTRNKYGF